MFLNVMSLPVPACHRRLVLTNDLATALYLILVSRLCDNKYLGTFGVMFYMNVRTYSYSLDHIISHSTVLTSRSLSGPDACMAFVFCVSSFTARRCAPCQ